MSPYFERNRQRAFGTFPLKGEAVRAAVAHAAEAGFRAFDTAQMYDNEADVGEALEATGLRDLFVTTKVHPDNFTVEAFVPSVERSLADLRMDSVDVLLLHWPPADGEVDGPLELLAEARDKGLARHVGVSNFTVAMMERAVAILGEVATNQVEFHPLIDQSRLLEGATRLGVPLSAWSSIARGRIFEHAIFDELASAYGVQPAQVALRWILQKGVSVNVMSTKPANIAANYDVMGWTLSHVDMARIDALSREVNWRMVTSDVVPWAPDWD